MPRLLLVEDNDMNRDMLSRRLLRRGYDVILAVNGEEAVAKALSESPDLILMDMSLPIMDGWEATRQIRASKTGAKTPIIGLSAHAMKNEEDSALAAGCDLYFTKPVDFNRLIEAINTSLVDH